MNSRSAIYAVYKKFDRIENLLFYSVVILSVIPVFCFAFFPTLDGPAHLYNSNLIIELIKDNSHLSQIFSLNSFTIPNLTGHVILALFRFFLPAGIAEKLLLALYFAGFPVIFRKFIISIKGEAVFSWFAIPFSYSFMLYMGFYNFCIGTLFFFLALYFWFKIEKIRKRYIVILLFSLLIYYSHIVVFSIFIFNLGMLMLYSFILEICVLRQKGLKKLIINALLLLLVLLPSLCLAVHYISSHSLPNRAARIPPGELLVWIFKIRSLVAYNISKEQQFTIPCLLLIMTLLLYPLIIKINRKAIKKESLSSVHKLPEIWLILGLVMLFLYFFLPDEIGSGGYISVRMNWFFFIFLIIWLSVRNFHKSLRLIIVLCILFIHSGMLLYHTRMIRTLSRQAMAVSNAGKFIEPNSVVLPVSFSGPWVQKHFSNYLGMDKPLIILENYEASTDYFPVCMNHKKLPSFYLENGGSLGLCAFLQNNGDHQRMKVDYLLITGSAPDTSLSCNKDLLYYCRDFCSKEYSNTFVFLFKCNRP